MPTATTSAPLVNTISAASGSPKIWSSNLRVREGEEGESWKPPQGREHVGESENGPVKDIKDLLKEKLYRLLHKLCFPGFFIVDKY